MHALTRMHECARTPPRSPASRPAAPGCVAFTESLLLCVSAFFIHKAGLLMATLPGLRLECGFPLPLLWAVLAAKVPETLPGLRPFPTSPLPERPLVASSQGLGHF